ncbi:MAG: hypothetical protein ABIA93_07850 [Candidatus Woesearchaeota archaeon]
MPLNTTFLIVGLLIGGFLAGVGSFIDKRMAGWLFVAGVLFGIGLGFVF